MTLNFIRDNAARIAQLYVMAREFNADLNLDRILRRVLIATTSAVGATHGSLLVFDDHENCTQGLVMRESQVSEAEPAVAGLMLQTGVAGWVKTHKAGVVIEDSTKDGRWVADPSQPDGLSHHSAVSVPLLAGQKIIGLLTVSHDKAGYFDQHDLTMLKAVADPATAAIRNGQVHQAEQRRRQLSQMLADFSRHMNATDQVEVIFELIFEQLARIIAYDQCLICLIKQGYLTVTAARGLVNWEELHHIPVRLYKNDFALPITQAYIPLWTENLQTKNSWFRDVTDTASRSWLGAPLLSNDGLLGVITVARRVPGAYSDEEVEMVNMLASQAAIAVHKANLLNQLQGAKSRYTHLFEESSDLILIMDPQGLILDANRKACHMLRRPKDAMIGSDLALLGLNLRETFKKQATELARRKEITTELTIMDAYRQEIPVEITAKQVEIESRSVIQWVGRDLTARRQLAQMRQDLTQMIVHDLRGPMGTLLGAVELLPYLIKAEASQDGVTKALELLQVALHTGQTLRDLVDSMLDLTKLEQGSFPLRVGPVNMQELFMEVEKQVTPLAAAKETQLTFEPVAANLTFDLDGSVIRRVLVNLVDNAIKYTPPGGEVEIKVLVDGDKLTFKVIDNGPGVSPEKHQEIFDKFSRVDHQAKIQGVGLGLAFCKMAIEAHYGQIWIESELNVGSTFIVEIPLNLAK